MTNWLKDIDEEAVFQTVDFGKGTKFKYFVLFLRTFRYAINIGIKLKDSFTMAKAKIVKMKARTQTMANQENKTQNITEEVLLSDIESGNIPQPMIDECENGKGDGNE